MYPESLLQWLGGMVVLAGVLGWIYLGISWFIERREKKEDK